MVAAVEALKIAFGGVAYIARVLEMSRSTIYAGIYELQAMRTENGDPPQRPSGDPTRIRRPGVSDHDFKHLSKGTLVPHGVYDYFGNVGFMTLGTSKETSDFVCDVFALAWEEEFRNQYPNATEILLTFDSGGANGVRLLRFKENLIGLSKRLGLPLRIAHYPPYTSKWHPIEHRLFCHVEHALAGVMLDSYETAVEAIGNTSTETGLRVITHFLEGLDHSSGHLGRSQRKSCRKWLIPRGEMPLLKLSDQGIGRKDG